MRCRPLACPEAGERCPVYILDSYLSKLPKTGTQDIFHLRPLEEIPMDPSLPWYSAVPVGRDTLHKKMSTMCKQAGVQGHITNHSLRATSATRMYERNVPEKIIQERTGHRSLESLRCYERTSGLQHQTVSNILSAPKPTQHSTCDRAHYSHTMTTDAGVHKQRTTYAPPGFSFQHLNGCTINIVNSTPPQVTSTTMSAANHSVANTEDI